MVHVASDVTALLQRREVAAYEQRLARSAYAYGVDLRRTAWLENSRFGDPLMRAVDHKWNAMVEDLTGSILQDSARTAPLSLMEEIAHIARLLRAPLPALRLLVRGMAPARWPIVTPLGTTKGAAHWLVIDAEQLLALPAHERAFAIGGALSHLQCDHGPVFAAHLMSDRSERGLGVVRTVLRPWSQVGIFSADRGGLIACGDLGAALSAMRAHAEPRAPWLPSAPALELREASLADFDRSSTMARLRVLLARHADQAPSLSGPAVKATSKDAPDDASGDSSGDDASSSDAPTAAPPRNPYRRAAAPPRDEKPPVRDEEMERALVGAWSLARCDARLTRRLGLL